MSNDQGAFTAADYSAGKPAHNARVFIDIWWHDIYGVDDDGIFEMGDSSGGYIGFDDLTGCIQQTDRYNKLDEWNVREAAAQVFRIAPELEWDSEGIASIA